MLSQLNTLLVIEDGLQIIPLRDHLVGQWLTVPAFERILGHNLGILGPRHLYFDHVFTR